MDGIRIQINRAVAAGKITPQVLGAMPTDIEAACDYVEAFVEGFSQRYQGVAMEIAMNPTLARRYAKGRAKKYGADTNATAPKPIIAGNGTEPGAHPGGVHRPLGGRSALDGQLSENLGYACFEPQAPDQEDGQHPHCAHRKRQAPGGHFHGLLQRRGFPAPGGRVHQRPGPSYCLSPLGLPTSVGRPKLVS
ncbi:hypothetical protein ACFQT0_19515 [Hymenobacter humi]|uniref:Uncharacterized protein n=1 Tax=Hymenobacter humi TaxID=1411620 RepID=A0ABW2U720_9BACT